MLLAAHSVNRRPSPRTGVFSSFVLLMLCIIQRSDRRERYIMYVLSGFWLEDLSLLCIHLIDLLGKIRSSKR